MKILLINGNGASEREMTAEEGERFITQAQEPAQDAIEKIGENVNIAELAARLENIEAAWDRLLDVFGGISILKNYVNRLRGDD